jgi:hypothetical protein
MQLAAQAKCTNAFEQHKQIAIDTHARDWYPTQHAAAQIAAVCTLTTEA